MIRKRASGILLHVSSLPSRYGVGDLGPGAYEWVDFLVDAGQSVWQVLPLNPTTARGHNSPYQAASAFAGNPLFISPDLLRDAGLLAGDDLDDDTPAFADETTDYAAAGAEKSRLLDCAWRRFAAGGDRGAFESFCAEHADWLDDYALFVALGERFAGREWFEWPVEVRDREPGPLASVAAELDAGVEREKFRQFLFFDQWRRLKRYANARGVRVVGDLPYYVGGESADVWSHARGFKLDADRRPAVVAGVPPDAFSATGQLWGNPVYDWPAHAADGYSWWLSRLGRNFELFDVVRIDHFRGFAQYWEVPAGDKTAEGGRWVDGPGGTFFDALHRKWPFAPVVAEDLGYITPDVRELIDRYQLPGMKVLLFAFDGDPATNPYSLHNHVPNTVLFTGTHDNNTVRGWFDTEAGPEEKKRLRAYLGRLPSAPEVHREFVRLAMMSVSRLVIVPMQDVLGLGEEARMNRPSVSEGNWTWRLEPGRATAELAGRLSDMAATYGRL